LRVCDTKKREQELAGKVLYLHRVMSKSTYQILLVKKRPKKEKTFFKLRRSIPKPIRSKNLRQIIADLFLPVGHPKWRFSRESPRKSTLNSGLVVICPVQILQLEDPGSPLKTPAGGGSRERKMFWRLPPKLVKLLLWLDRPAESVLQVGIVGFCL